MATRFNHRARRSERTRLLSERVERLNANMDRQIKNGNKKATPESKQPEVPVTTPRENPYTRMLRKLHADRQK
jgi:hypothetical protein